MDRMNANMQGGPYGFDMPSAQTQTWNPNAFGAPNGLPAFGATGRMKPMPRGRSALPPVSHPVLSVSDPADSSAQDMARSASDA